MCAGGGGGGKRVRLSGYWTDWEGTGQAERVQDRLRGCRTG